MSSVALHRRENDAHAAQLFGPAVPPAAAILESPAWGSRVRCLAKATYGLPATKAQDGAGDASEAKPTSTALILGDGRSKRPRDADPGVGAVESRGIVAVSTEKLRAEAEQAASAEDRAAVDAQRYPQWGLKRMTVAHKGRVTSLAVDPSNMWYASGSADSVIKAWDLASGKLRANLTGHTAAVRGLAMSELSPYMFSCGEDKQVKCWDLETNRIVRDFFGHLSAVYTVAAHPRQDIIVTGGRDATVRVWDVRSRSCVHVMQGHSESVFTVQAQDAEPQVVSGAADGMVYLWDIASGRPITRLTRHKKSVRGAVLHPAEATMATCGADGVRKWRLPHGEYMGKATSLPDAPDGLWSCAALSARDVLFVGADDGGHMRFYDWGSSTMFQHRPCKSVKGTLPGEGGVLCCAFDRSGQRLLTGEGDKTVKVWAEKPKAEHDADQARGEATASFAAPMT